MSKGITVDVSERSVWTSQTKAKRFTPELVEWQTVLLILAIYSAWLSVTLYQKHLPLPVLFCVGGCLVAWHSSVQHEIIHGHPTPWSWVNNTLAFPPLSIWLPFEIFRTTHLEHHIREYLTDPVLDPESKYYSGHYWSNSPGLVKFVLLVKSTLLGHLVIGPFWMIGTFLVAEVKEMLNGDLVRLRIWLVHLLGIAAVITWLQLGCGLTVEKYILCFVYPGILLQMLRSFSEHKAAVNPAHRTAIVENEPLLGLLFLHNNLHAVHHNYPGISWYKLPELYSQNRSLFISLNGGLVYDGYGDVIKRYLLRAQDELVHPAMIGDKPSNHAKRPERRQEFSGGRGRVPSLTKHRAVSTTHTAEGC